MRHRFVCLLAPFVLALRPPPALPAQEPAARADSVRTVFAILLEVRPKQLGQGEREDWEYVLVSTLKEKLRGALPDSLARRIEVVPVPVSDSVRNICGSADCEFVVFLEESVERSIQTRLTLFPEYTKKGIHRAKRISQPYPEDCGHPAGDPWEICRDNFGVYAGRLVDDHLRTHLQPRGTP